MEKLEEVLARRLRQLAQARGLPLSHVADRAGVARSFLWRILDAKSSPTLATVQRLARVLDVPPLALLGAAYVVREPSRLAVAEPRTPYKAKS